MIVAKFHCSSVRMEDHGEVVHLSAVTHQAGTPDDPNLSWSKATPHGDLSMTISNPDAQGRFEQGKCYLLHFEPAGD